MKSPTSERRKRTMSVLVESSPDVRVSGQLDWNSIAWNQAERSVRKLQERIVKAQELAAGVRPPGV